MSFTDNFGNPKGIIGRMMLVTMEREHLPMAKWALEKLEIPQEGYILDIGCGGGYNIKRMLQMSDNGRFIGLDISEESVRKAKKINSGEIGKRVKILQGSAENLPCKPDSLSLVTAFETVFFWNDVDTAFASIYNCLKKGGSFAAINNYGDPDIDWEKKVPCMTRYTAEELKEKMELAGFTDITADKKDNLFMVCGKKA